MGREIYIVAQSKDHAKVHLQDFRKMVLASKYHDYLVTKPMPSIGLLKDEVTKTDEAYLHNPKNPFRPTHIYAKGFEAGQLISHKRVKHIHASDISKSKLTAIKQKEAFGAMMSRLANTGGSCVMESIFGGIGGPMFEQYEKYEELQKTGIKLDKLTRREQQKYAFYCRKLRYDLGIKAGIITPEFIEGEKTRHGPLFAMFYEAEALIRKRLMEPAKADIIRTLKEELLREMIVPTNSGRISFDHPINKNNDTVHSWELSLKAVMEYQKNRLGDGFADMFPSVHVKRYNSALDIKSKTQLTRDNVLKRIGNRKLGSNTKINVEMPSSE